MASPQTEDGHIRIANSLFDAALAYPFTARQLKALLAVMRLTYGYRRKSDRITAGQVATLAGMQRPHAVKALGDLVEQGVIWRKQIGRQAFEIGVVKDFEQWGTRYQIGTSSEPSDGSQSGTESVSEPIPNRYQSTDTESVLVKNATDTESVPDRYQIGIGTDTESVHTKDKRQFPKTEEAAAVVGSSLDLVGEAAAKNPPTEPLPEPDLKTRLIGLFGPEAVAHGYLRLETSTRHIADPRGYLIAACRGYQADERDRAERRAERDKPKESLVARSRRLAEEQLARLHDEALASHDGAIRPPVDQPARRELGWGFVEE